MRRGLRALAVLPLPAVAAVLYLTSSRGGAIAAGIAVVAFVALSARRWAAAVAVAVAAGGSAAVIGVLSTRTELVNDPFGSSAAVGQGRTAAVLVFVICLATALLYGGLLSVPVRAPTVPRLVTWAAIGVVVLGLAAALAAGHPGERFRHFKQPPKAIGATTIEAHLFSGSGRGRWQLWTAAAQAFRAHPVAGGGAGSYEAWWAQHRTIQLFVRNAHSLYMETLAELGVVGLALLLGALVSGLVVGVVRLRAATGDARVALAALLAAYLAYLFEAGVDWMWQVTAVTVLAFACLGLMTGPATALSARRVGAVQPRANPLVRVGALAVAWFCIGCLTIPLLAELKVEQSQAAVRNGNSREAIKDALDARKLQSWAATPYLQLALVQEASGNLPAAQGAIVRAISNDASDWRLWLVAARIATESGDVPLARRYLHEAEHLNPLSPIFRSTLGG